MFVNLAEQHLENDSEFYRKIIFSDETHFWLKGFVNKQTMHYWSESTLDVLHESSLHSDKITVCYGLWAGGVIGLNIFGQIKYSFYYFLARQKVVLFVY